ncbi:MAG: SGNH/GDSL hydrolase family protein [Planctomycetes bacterium]|nr:SGNH/GDSL hydrolase family protein [Planctomycetota bacterium]
MVTTPRKRRWRRRLFGAAFGLVFGLILAEGTLRLLGYSPAHVNPLRAFHCADPVLVYRGRPDVVGRFRRPQFDVEVRHDHRGFRMPEAVRDRNEVAGTIHCFGDSFTWGWGVETGEVFTDVLRRALPDQAVRNYGINGSGTALHLRLLETEVRRDVRPGDRVLLMLFYNDYFDNTVTTRLHGRIEGDRVIEVVPAGEFDSSLGQWLKEHCYLANFAAHVFDMQKASRMAAEQRASTDPRGDGPSPTQTRIMRHFLARFRDVCQELGAEFALVWVPDSRDVDARAHGRPSVFFDAVTDLAKGLDVELIDPTDALVAAAQGGAVTYFDGDEHWTPAGHATVAEVLAQRLR